MLETLKFIRCNDVCRIKIHVFQILVYWPIYVAFEVAAEELKIDNLPCTKQVPIEIIEPRGEILRFEIQNLI